VIYFHNYWSFCIKYFWRIKIYKRNRGVKYKI